VTRATVLKAVVARAQRNALDPALVAAVVEQESDFDPLAYREEPHLGDASRGLMQLLYSTARGLGYNGPPDGLFDIETNLQLGSSFLRHLLHRYGDQRSALAAYNAGEPAVDSKGWECVRRYVEKTQGRIERLRLEIETLALGETPIAPEPYRRFPLPVPFVSQLEPDGLGYNNCGPACVTMALAYNGVAAGTRDTMHRVAEEIRKAPWNSRTYTSFQQMKAGAQQWKVPCRELVTWDQAYATLDGGQPVMILLRNELLRPRLYDLGPSFDGPHFILLLGYDEDTFHISDPLRVYGRGPGTYARPSVHLAAAHYDPARIHALAIDRVPPGWSEDGDEDEPPIAISDSELKAYLESRGQGVNMDTALIKLACLSYRRRETRGPAIGDEFAAISPDGRAVVRQHFTGGTAEYDPETGQLGWVEVVLHPDALPSPLPPPSPVPTTTSDTTQEEEVMRLLQVSAEEVRAYFEQLVATQGQGLNMETAIMKRAVLAYRRGEGRGPATSGEYPALTPDSRNVIRQDFTAGIAEYDPNTGEVRWVDIVAEPSALRERQPPRSPSP
jgi:hypothetical protein